MNFEDMYDATWQISLAINSVLFALALIGSSVIAIANISGAADADWLVLVTIPMIPVALQIAVLFLVLAAGLFRGDL